MTRFERWMVLGASLVVALTGFAYWWMKYALEPASPWDAVNHPLQPLVLKLHILAAPVLVFAVGLIALRHVWRHVRERRREGRRAGLVLLWVLLPMVASGYLIQALTAPGWLRAVAWAHIATGVAYAGGLLLHWLTVGRGRYPALRLPAPRRRRAPRRDAVASAPSSRSAPPRT